MADGLSYKQYVYWQLAKSKVSSLLCGCLAFIYISPLKDVGGMMSISVEAAAARDSLKNDKELINTYEVELLYLFILYLTT